MEDFARMVETYKWRGPSSTQQQKEALPFSQRDGEWDSCGSGCSQLSPAGEENCSSPSTSLHCNMGHSHTGSTQAMKTDADDPGESLFSAAGWKKPRQKPNVKKKMRAAPPSRSSRQLVFSVKDTVAEDNTERRLRPEKRTKKNRGNRKNFASKPDGKRSNSQRQACNSVDSCEHSVCEDGPLTSHEFDSPDVCHSPVQGDTKRSAKRGIQCVSMNGKSPYFMPLKRKKKMNNSNKNKDRPINKVDIVTAEFKACTQKQPKEGKWSKQKTNRTNAKDLAGQDFVKSDLQNTSELNAHSSKQPVDSSNLDIAHSTTISGARKSVYFETTSKALGQRDIANKTWIPPISVHALIQEELYKDPWKVLVACMLLNKTSGKAMRQIIWDLFDLCPTPEAAVAVETSKIEDVIRGLGLQKKRALMIQKFSKDFLGKNWTNVGQLHGIGKYATDAYAIFCEGRWQEVKPEDHKLVDYWKYLCATDGHGYAFKDDREHSHEGAPPVTSVEV